MKNSKILEKFLEKTDHFFIIDNLKKYLKFFFQGFLEKKSQKSFLKMKVIHNSRENHFLKIDSKYEQEIQMLKQILIHIVLKLIEHRTKKV